MKRFGSVLVLGMLVACPVVAFATDAAQPMPAVAPSVAVVPAAQALSATDVVKNFYAELTETMKQGAKLGFAGRYKKLDPAMHQAFNLPLMAKVSVGLVWSSTTPAEQEQIVSAFSNFSVATYANRFSKYDGEQFNVGEEKNSAGGKIVETTLKPKDSDAVALNYLMRQDETGAWRIVDVFLNGSISELATRRSEFSSVIKRDGIAALVNSLGEKSKPIGPT